MAIAATIIGLSLTGAAPAIAASRVSYAGSQPTWAKSANDAGTPAADTSVEGELYLNLKDSAGAAKFATAVSTPGNPLYRHFLTPAQWISKYSPTTQSVTSLLNYLKLQGVTIVSVPASRQYVVFRGSVDQINTIFGAALHNYSVKGTKLVGPSKAPSLPASVAAVVSGISIDQSRTLTRPDSIKRAEPKASVSSTLQRKATAAPSVSAGIPTPCSNYIGEHTVTVPAAYGKTTYSTLNCGYVPAQMRSAYGLTSLAKKGLNGSGQTVAIIDAYASPSIVQDVNTYSTTNHEPTLAKGQYSQIVPKPSQFADQEACQEPSGWQGEQTLDVEAVHGIAPAAKILYVGGYNCGGGLDIAMSTILDKKLATIVSNSYGNIGEDVPYNTLVGENNLYIQAAGEGIGLYFSSGDNGDEVANLGIPSPDFAASSPWVTSVGGTSLGINKAGAIAFETGWGDVFDPIVKDSLGKNVYSEPLPGSLFVGGAGGGTSGVFAQPAYQKGTVPASLAKGMRVSPDIAALADPYTGYSVGLRPIVDDDTLATGDYEASAFGGTSLASPLTAAQVALVQQATHTTIGFANPTLYAVHKVLPSTFRDVLPTHDAVVYTGPVSGNTWLVSFNNDTTLKTTKGYDDVTGLGGITFNLLTQMAKGRH